MKIVQGRCDRFRNQPFVQLAVPAGSDQYRKLANGHE